MDSSPGLNEQDAETQRGWFVPDDPQLVIDGARLRLLCLGAIFSHDINKQSNHHNFFLQSQSVGKPLPSFPFSYTDFHLT